MNRQSEETKENLTISDNHYSSDNNANSGEEGQGFFAKIQQAVFGGPSDFI